MSKSTSMASLKVVGAVTAGVMITASVTTVAVATASPQVAPASQHLAPAIDTPPAASVHTTSWRGPASVSVRPAPASRVQRPSRAAVARQAVLARQARFTAFTTTSKDTRDMRGVEKSLYRGRFYKTSSESKRLCIVERESEGQYDVVNPSGAYRGAYQVSASLARGATWMMLKEHKALMGQKAAKRVLGQLRSKPMNTWPRYWQDAAFHTVINWDHALSGAAHWAGGRWHC